MKLVIKKGLLDKGIEIEQFIDHNPENREEVLNLVQFTITDLITGDNREDVILRYDIAKELYEELKEIFE